MERKQIENLYIINGLTDYKLKSIEDLLKGTRSRLQGS